MGTYDSSRYVNARKPHTCAECRAVIEVGANHLVWQTGQKHSHRICHPCSLKIGNDGQPVFWCLAVVDELRQQSIATLNLRKGSNNDA